MKKSLTRSTGFWLLPVLSLASAGVGGWLISGQIGTMTTTLLAGTATGVEVYVGQSLVVVGAALLGAGVLGLLLTFALVAVQAMLPAPAPVIVEPIDWTAEAATPVDAEASSIADAAIPAQAAGSATPVGEAEPAKVPASVPAVETPSNALAVDEDEDQKGSSGSIATATKISVK